MRCTVVFHASLIPLSISRSSASPVKFDIMQCYKTLPFTREEIIKCVYLQIKQQIFYPVCNSSMLNNFLTYADQILQFSSCHNINIKIIQTITKTKPIKTTLSVN